MLRKEMKKCLELQREQIVAQDKLIKSYQDWHDSNERWSKGILELSCDESSMAGELSDFVSDILTERGYKVYYPVHVELKDESGTEYISDLYAENDDNE